MADGAAVLIAAISGRALAASARRGGYLPLVADFFGDEDTLQVAQAHVRFGGKLAQGIEEEPLMRALHRLSEREEPLGIVCGTGFEDRTQLLADVARRWRLFGNEAQTVAKVKDPGLLSSICAASDIPFPELSPTKPAAPADWLAKRTGGSGGSHIKPARQSPAGESAIYYQRKKPGIPISALFLADGTQASVLGFSEQWSSPASGKPYRYGGAVRPAPLAPRAAATLAAAVDRLVPAAPLVGLNSADFLVDGECFWLLDVNPRPGATLDIFEPPEASLFVRHMQACAGKLGSAPRYADGAEAAAVVYAEHDIGSAPLLDWPDWSADRPSAGSAIGAGEPLCTVYACGSAAAGAKALANERRELVLAWMGARQQ